MTNKKEIIASIIIIGNEVLSGRTKDLNTSTLSIWLNSIGMSHRTLRWMNSSKNNTGVQAAARFARLKLMGKWCRDNSIIHLLIAHHQEDQSDTFLTRLASGSGIDGLSAMPKSRLLTFHEGGGIRLLRPLLNTPSADLSATLETYSQPWVSEPTTSDAQ